MNMFKKNGATCRYRVEMCSGGLVSEAVPRAGAPSRLELRQGAKWLAST